jgi:16S rRNA (guanine1516-N2)-methyltransferase
MAHVDLPSCPDGLQLVQSKDGLTLVGTDGLELRGDFTRLLPRLRPSAVRNELLVKAARVKGIHSPVVVDATAGLGEDSLLLAAAGCVVTLYERDAVIAALLADALERATHTNELRKAAGRMKLVKGDAVAGLRQMASSPDVVYLDPMFPGRRKSAAVKKKLQLMQRLERPCDNEQELMEAAFSAGPRKVVVKRPAKGPFLADAKPSYTLAGKAVRFDVYVR